MEQELNNPITAKIIIDFYRDGKVKVESPSNEILVLGLLQKTIQIILEASKSSGGSIKVVPSTVLNVIKG